MREIKFRGIPLGLNEFIYGSCVVYKDQCFIYTEMYEKTIHLGILNQVQVSCNTIGQYTGLLDKFRKKIYEGDILKYSGHWFGDSFEVECIELVKWDEWDASYPWKLTATGWRDGPEWREIIGNIHENPTLLKELKNAPT